MKSVTRWIPIVFVCALPALADSRAIAAGPPPRDVDRVVYESLYDLTGQIYNFPCSETGEVLPITDGEPILIEGQIYERITQHDDGADGVHYRLNTMPVGLRGIGQWSGEEFRITESAHAVINFRHLKETTSYKQELKMVGRESHRAFLLMVDSHYSISNDGEMIVGRSAERVECIVR
jgi:hypothetical protein